MPLRDERDAVPLGDELLPGIGRNAKLDPEPPATEVAPESSAAIDDQDAYGAVMNPSGRYWGGRMPNAEMASRKKGRDMFEESVQLVKTMFDALSQDGARIGQVSISFSALHYHVDGRQVAVDITFRPTHGHSQNFDVPVASYGTQATTLAVQLAAAAAERGAGQHVPAVDRDRTMRLLRMVAGMVQTGQIEALRNKKVLWSHNDLMHDALEHDALATCNVEVRFCHSTAEALLYAQREHYDVIISNMGQEHDNEAGFTLIEKLRANNIRIPLIIYTRNIEEPLPSRAKEKGVFGMANVPEDLLVMLMRAVEYNKEFART